MLLEMYVLKCILQKNEFLFYTFDNIYQNPTHYKKGSFKKDPFLTTPLTLKYLIYYFDQFSSFFAFQAQ